MNFLHTIKRRLDSSRCGRLVVYCLIYLAVFSCLLVVSWHRWGDLIVDTSRELWVPRQLLGGKALYRDVYYFHGFLPAYLLAFLYGLFGVHVNPLIACGIGVTFLISLYLYKVSRFFLDEIVSLILTLNYLVVFAFGAFHETVVFNTILPYSFASIFCLLFVIAALYHFLRYFQTLSSWHLILWGMMLSIAGFSRPETALSVWIGFAFIGAVAFFKSGPRLKPAVYFGLLMTPVVTTVVVYCLVLWKLDAFAGFKETFIDSVLYAGKGGDVFVVRQAGLDDVATNALLMAKSIFLHAVLIIAVGLGVHLVRKEHSCGAGGGISVKAGLGVVLIVAAALIANVYLVLPAQDLQYRCVPALLVVAFVYLFAQLMRPGHIEGRQLQFLTTVCVAFILAFKIILSATPKMYGFYLLATGLLCYYVICLEFVDRVCRRFLLPGSAKAARGVLVAIFATMVVTSGQISFGVYQKRNLEVETKRGTFFCIDSPISYQYWNAVNYLVQNSGPDDELVVFPEGASLNFFSGLNNPMRFYTFLPGDLAKVGETRVIDELQKSSVKFIALIHRNTEEYGAPFFGVDYAVKLSSWIFANYAPVQQFGARPFTSEYFGVLVLRKRSSGDMPGYPAGNGG